MRQLPLLPLAGCVLFLAAAPAFAQQQNIPTVATVAAQMKPVTKRLDFVGRVEAINRVEIRARVKGFLDAVLFKEGDTVKAGQAVLITEAMKMETEVQAAIAGKVTAVHVAKGDRVNPGEILIEIEG